MTVAEFKAFLQQRRVPDDTPLEVWSEQWGSTRLVVEASWSGTKVVLVDEDNQDT